jgi:EmrB/QacA subfamily drug resistance transporter
MTSNPPTSDIEPGVFANRWKILVVLCLSLMVIMIANGSLNVALPQLAHDLDASTSALQWMVDAYSLVFAGMLFTAGTLGDRFGRKRALQGGLILFLLAAIAASMSNTAGQVIAARAVMGVAAAFVMPSTLSLLTNVFPPSERAKAISVWAGIAAGGAALGPPISGFLVEHFWWGSVFLINVPLLLVAIVAGRMLVPESRNPDEHRVDVPGAVLSILGVSALVYAIIEAPSHGWGSTETLGAFGLAAVALAAFTLREMRTSQPMFDLRLLRDGRFTAASMGISVCFFAMFGVMFLLAQYLQMVLDYSPFHAGLLMLPMPLVMMAVAPQAPRMVVRYGVATVVPAGMVLITIGLCILSLLDTGTPVVAIYPALVPMMVGMAISMSPLTTLIMTSVPRERAGMGSATNDTTRELGGALGVAVLGSVVTTHFRTATTAGLAGASGDVRSEALSGLAGAVTAARSLPADAGGALVADAQKAFADGMSNASLVAAVIVAAFAVVSVVTLRRAVRVHGTAVATSPEAAEAVAVTEVGLLEDLA